MSRRRVGLHHDQAHLAHDVPGHPERPDRVRAIYDELARTDLLPRFVPVPERVATEAELRLVHHPDLIELLRKLDAAGGAQLDPDTAILSGSFDAAARAV
ncbi:MAG: histone deacetylase, partial [Dehalococcoidia bacterium]